MIDCCAGICLTARAWVLLDQHRNFAGCDLNSDAPSAEKPDLFLTFALRVLDPLSATTRDEEVTKAT